MSQNHKQDFVGEERQYAFIALNFRSEPSPLTKSQQPLPPLLHATPNYRCAKVAEQTNSKATVTKRGKLRNRLFKEDSNLKKQYWIKKRSILHNNTTKAYSCNSAPHRRFNRRGKAVTGTFNKTY